MHTLAKKIKYALGLVTMACTFSFAGNSDNLHDNSRISIFLQPAISFLGFDERSYFQDAIDTIYNEFLVQSLDKTDSTNVAKQDFQKVNFCFPVSAGLQFQVFQDHFLSAGVSFIYDNESVVITDRQSHTHNYSYTIQGIPLFLEYRFAIPTNLMNISNESLLSVAFRWYWAMPHTEIYSSWGKASAETKPLGAGFGFSVGYLITQWKNLNIFGDVGYSSIKVKSKTKFKSIVPEGPNEKTSWDIGGLQLQIRVSFGVWNKPTVDESTEQAQTSANSKTE